MDAGRRAVEGHGAATSNAVASGCDFVFKIPNAKYYANGINDISVSPNRLF
jgi:hypothetical protein